MEMTLNSRVDAPSGFLVALRHRMRIFRAHRQHRQELTLLTRLPNHVLRDIGFEDLITHRTSPGPSALTTTFRRKCHKMSFKLVTPTAIATVVLATLASIAHSEIPIAFDAVEDHNGFLFESTQAASMTKDAPYIRRFTGNGYIYPAGTLSEDVTGVDASGNPALPNLVIGHWTSEGWYVGNARQSTTGAWIVSRQVFVFETGETLITRGEEMVNQTDPSPKAIIGGTEDTTILPEVLYQTLLGYTDDMSPIFTHHFSRADGVF